ncbi:hypothetical protein NEDG_00235 [Nematocida displodere]|uniref:Myb proto-oncogene protein, plant n=1 Tax=Nematocida displodere TaxID=1805483 RepID=A0A177EK61_9MICR|nr:hypothetical protein NEDG_00235 [Nematocida displodere]
MEEEELFGAEEVDIEAVERKLLNANRALQAEKHQEYLDMLVRLDMIAVAKKLLAATRKKTKRRMLLTREHLDGSTPEEAISTTQTKRIIDTAAEYARKEASTNILIDAKVWHTIAESASLPVATCQKVWYSPKNPFYIQGRWTQEEDEEILLASGKWPQLYTKLRRAPLSIFLRYKAHQQREAISSAWTPEEDELLVHLAQSETAGAWIKIATHLKSKTPRQCMYRYIRKLAPYIRRGKWTAEEDEALLKAVGLHKKGNWKKIKESVPGRSGFQCRERYLYILDPTINNTPWAPEEEEKLLQLAESMSKDWALISKEIATRNGRQCRLKYLQLMKDKEGKPEAS